MNAIKQCAVLASLSLLMVSCVEHSGKYKTVVAQRDSLAVEKQALDSSFNKTVALLNDIEAGFSEINKGEKQMLLTIKGAESKNPNQREKIFTQMQAIKENMEQNKAKIEELRKLVSKGSKENKLLTETINRLQNKMDEQVVQIESIQAELARKNIQIGELTATVSNQQGMMEQQKATMTEQVAKLSEQELEQNRVWYCIATSKQLKAAKIITDAGLFSTKKVMINEFDNSAFTVADLRSTTSIATQSKSVKILSSHPKTSYQLVTGADNTITIQITDPVKFWSVSNYLVVQK